MRAMSDRDEHLLHFLRYINGANVLIGYCAVERKFVLGVKEWWLKP